MHNAFTLLCMWFLGRRGKPHQTAKHLCSTLTSLACCCCCSSAGAVAGRCLLHWGLLHQTEQCPFLEQLAAVLQAQLDLEDASAPADVAGLQCHVANRWALQDSLPSSACLDEALDSVRQ